MSMFPPPESSSFDLVQRRMACLLKEYDRIMAAIREHHAQKADDRCWLDDVRLYEAVGLPPADYRVGNKEEMLANCTRYLDRRCQGGHWPSYRELEEQLENVSALLAEERQRTALVESTA